MQAMSVLPLLSEFPQRFRPAVGRERGAQGMRPMPEGGYMKNVLFGLTVESSNQAILDMVFNKAHEARYFSLSTLPAEGSLPGSRFLDFMRCADDGLLYFGVGTGKPCNEDIEAHPVVTLNGSFVGDDTGESEHRQLISFRITGRVRRCDNPEAEREYWERNPGSRKMWEKSMDSFVIYCLWQGEGELYQVYKNDRIYRLRFGFGGVAPRPFHYRVNEALCVGCGACVEACTAGIMTLENGKAHIPFQHCYECGVCRKACPQGAIEKSPRSDLQGE